MSESHISIEDFVDAVRETAERSGASSEFKSFVLALYERVVFRQSRNVLLPHSHYEASMYYLRRQTKTASRFLVIGKSEAEEKDAIGRLVQEVNDWMKNWRCDHPISPYLTHYYSYEQRYKQEKSYIEDLFPSLKGVAPSTVPITDPIINLHHKPDDSDSKDLNEIDAMLTSMESQVDDAIQQIGQSRKEVEASFARTQTVKEATEKILASIRK